MEELTESGWKPETSMGALLLLVRTALLDGGGKIDPRMGHIPYALEESRESYVRVARQHGWTPATMPVGS